MKKKIVLCPVEVPVGKYCWTSEEAHFGCQFWSNHLEVGVCRLGFSGIKSTPKGALKSKECLYLKEVD